MTINTSMRWCVTTSVLLLCSLATVRGQNLINVRLAGDDPGVPNGAAVVGLSGDTWNYFPNLNGRANGGGVVTNAAVILDANGATLPGVTLTLSLSGGNGLDRYTDNTSFNPNPVTVMGQYIYESDGQNYWTVNFTGLPANQAYNLYGMGNGNADGQGTTWWVDVANGHATASATAGFASGDRDATNPGNEGICWIKVSATTTGSGQLTFRVVRLGAAENGTGGSGRAYLNAFQLQPATTAPMILSQPTDQTVLLGGTANFNVAASGLPAPAFQWLKDGTNLTGETGSSLTITNTQPGDAGTYSVLVSNSVGSVVSSNVLLSVTDPVPPAFSVQPGSLEATIGQTVVLSAAATGVPAPTYQWLKNGMNVNGATNATLTLVNVQAPDAGMYSVMASNSVDAVTSSNTMLTVAVPDGYCMINGATTGGSGGTVVTVTNSADFITHATTSSARVIQVQGVLTIGTVSVNRNKTIVGLGTNATLLGRLAISGVTNIIVRNLRISNPGEDGITVRDPNTHHIWVDHCTFYDCGDGSCDISQGADYVTVSWCKFMYPMQEEHRFTMIADGPKDLGPLTARITLHHNWWASRSDQRMAATSDALVHYYNNYFNCSNNSYCSNARNEAELNIENNYYSGVKDPVGVSSGTNGKIKTSGNLYPGCTGTIHPGTDSVFTPPYAYALDATADVPGIVAAGAGAPGPDTVPVPPKVWDGGGADNNLGSANNWGFNEAPKPYDTLLFAGSTRLAPNNNFSAGTEMSSIDFSNSAGAFVLGGNTLRFGGSIRDDSPNPQTINLNLDFSYAADHFSMNREFNVSAANGSLVVNGNITGVANGYNKPYVVAKRGGGLLTLNGANSFPGSFNFEGGLVRFGNAGNLGTTNLAFDGGGLQWAGGNTTDISGTPVLIKSGGATFDVGANNVSFSSPVGVGGAGGLTKLGSGRLTLNGGNTYGGLTLVSQGTLALGPAGSISSSVQIVLSNNATLDVSGRSDGTLTLGSGKCLLGSGSILGSVTAGSGATIAPGFPVGTLVVTNMLTFLSGCTNQMDLDATAHTNDLITGMAGVSYGGRLVLASLGDSFAAGDTFKLFSAGDYSGSFSSIVWPALGGGLYWTNKLAVDGTISVVSPVNTTPTNLSFSLDSGMLQLSWPDDRTGWRLEVQTNSPGAGLGTDWVSLGYASTNAVQFPVSTFSGSIFYRLAYP